MKTAFCIPVYKLRDKELLGHVNDIAQEYDVFIFAQTSWPDDIINLQKQKEEKNWVDNVYLENVNCDNIAAKRYCMTNRIIDLGYDGMFMCDDDIRWFCHTTEGCEKRETSDFYKKRKVTVVETAKAMQQAAINNNAIYVGISSNELATAGTPPGTIKDSSSLIWSGYTYTDLIKHKESGVQYIQEFNTFEQHDILLKYLISGYKTLQLCSYCFATSATDANSVIFGTEKEAQIRKLDTLFMNLFVKYGDYLSLHYRTKSKLAHIGCRIRWNKISENIGNFFLEPSTELSKKLYLIGQQGNLELFLETLKNKY